jgi:hypothetical protein
MRKTIRHIFYTRKMFQDKFYVQNVLQSVWLVCRRQILLGTYFFFPLLSFLGIWLIFFYIFVSEAGHILLSVSKFDLRPLISYITVEAYQLEISVWIVLKCTYILYNLYLFSYNSSILFLLMRDPHSLPGYNGSWVNI